jgi:hypothetical protein
MTHRVLVAVLLSVGLAALATRPAFAQTSYPMLMFSYPTALERGKTTEVTVNSRFTMAGAYKVLVEGSGVTAEILAADAKPDPKKPDAKPLLQDLKLKLTVAADAELGPREFRIATPQGVSSIGLVTITDTPTVLEKEPNNTRDQAQAIELPVVVNGKVQANEDVDVFRFSARAGEELAFVVEAARLEDKIHDLQNHIDPIILLTDASGRELATSDDYFRADPLLLYRVEKDGDYCVQVRDVRYMGDPRWTYALTATRRPFVTAVHPLAVRRGGTTELRPVGSGLGGVTTIPLRVPDGWECGVRGVQLETPAGTTNPVSVVVSDLDESVETEDNNDFEHAGLLAVPGGVSGRMDADNDVDCYKFAAKKGQAFRFEIQARRLDSLLDSYLAIIDHGGKELASNDDLTDAGLTSKDSRIDWAAPADGEYAVLVRDLNGRGGPAFVYHLTARPAEPDFALECDSDKALLGPGSSTAWYVKVARENGFAGDVRLEVAGLPAGVTAAPATIPAKLNQGCIVLSADWGTATDAANVRVIGRAAAKGSDGAEREITRVATPLEEIYSPGGGRARYPVHMQTVSVMEESDLVRIEVSRRQVTLAPGQTAQIDVNIKRSPGYTKPINLDVRLRHLGSVYGDPLPPGITLDEKASKTLLGENATQGSIVLKAAANATSVDDLPITVLANVSINFVVKVSYASAPIALTVPPKAATASN